MFVQHGKREKLEINIRAALNWFESFSLNQPKHLKYWFGNQDVKAIESGFQFKIIYMQEIEADLFVQCDCDGLFPIHTSSTSHTAKSDRFNL